MSLSAPPPQAITKRNGKRNRSDSIKPSTKDFKIWAKIREGITDEAIADAKGMDLLEVQEAYQKVVVYMRTNSIEVLRAKTHNVILDRLTDIDRIIGEFAAATTTRYVSESKIVEVDGKMVEKEFRREVVEIDYNTRKFAVETLIKLRDMVASKETKNEIQFGDRVINQNLSLSGRNFESRVRKKREERGLRNTEDSDDQVLEAEILDEVILDNPDVADEPEEEDDGE